MVQGAARPTSARGKYARHGLTAGGNEGAEQQPATSFRVAEVSMTAPICPYASELEDQVLDTGVEPVAHQLSPVEQVRERYLAQVRRWSKQRSGERKAGKR